VEANRGVLATFLWVLLPWLLLSCLGEGCALARWGERGGQFDQMVRLATNEIIRFELVQLLVGLGMVLAGAKMIQWVAEGFHMYPLFQPCFCLATYGFSPFFLARFLHCIPAISIWMSWAVGAVGCVYVLYQGIGIMLEPEATKGFGLYLVGAMIFLLLSGMAQLIALTALQATAMG
jgi:hypothetical protein